MKQRRDADGAPIELPCPECGAAMSDSPSKDFMALCHECGAEKDLQEEREDYDDV